MRAFFPFAITITLAIQVCSTLAKAASEGPAEDFFELCKDGEHWKLDDILEQKPHYANATNSEGDTCLHIAAMNNQEQVTEILLNKGANPNARSMHTDGLRMHPLPWSIYSTNFDLAKMHLEHGANVNLEFDLQYEEGGPKSVITTLDIIMLFFQNDSSRELGEVFEELLLKYGAQTYAQLHGQTHGDEL